MDQNVSRRNFIAGAAVGGAALGAGALAAQAAEKQGASAPADKAASAAATDAAAPTSNAEGAGWLGEAPKIEPADIVDTLETTNLIVGAGMSGMMAALYAAENGMDFLVAEKTPMYGGAHFDIAACNSRFQQEAGLEIDPVRWLNEWARYASFKNDQTIGRVWVDHSGEFVGWLADTYEKHSGVPSTVSVDVENGGDGRAGGTIYYIPPECHHISNDGYPDPEHEGRTLGHTGICEQIVKEDGYEDCLKYGFDLVELIREGDGPVTGAIFDTSDGYVQINAKNVVLATGGYANNPEMLKALNPLAVQATTSMNANPANTGQGIKAAMWVGAEKDLDPAAMLFDRGNVPPGVDAGYTKDGTFYRTGQHNLGSQPFLKVDRRGRRICNESANYDAICHAASNHPGGVWCLVMDGNCVDDVQRFQTQGCSAGTWKRTLVPGTDPLEAYAKQIEDGTIFAADTLDELADKLGFVGADKETFLATCDRYNQLYDEQLDEDFGKEPYRLSELRTPPFIGGWYGASILTTLDGLCINSRLQVLDTNEEPIEGLYAIGTCSGRYYSGNYPVYLVGNCLGRNTTFGYVVMRELNGEL